MQNLKFLVVEDDLFYQKYVNDLLGETGIDILNAPDGEAGLSMARAEKPDLIITDVEIPRMQGFALFKALRDTEETSTIPVIIMSGKVEKDLLDRHSRLSNRADGYLMKPFSRQDLMSTIRDILGEERFPLETPSHGDEGDPSGPGEEAPQTPFALEGESTPVSLEQAGKGRVLVVDDSQYILDIARDFIEELGVDVLLAHDGEEGYRLASEAMPDLVLLDVQMPKLNGFVVCEMLRKQEETSRIPVVLMSAVVDDGSFQRHSKLRYHADAYLQKPFMKSELQDLVKSYTTPKEGLAGDPMSKTGFLLPSEEEIAAGEGNFSSGRGVSKAVQEKLRRAKAEVLSLAQKESDLAARVEALRGEKEALEVQVHEEKTLAASREKALLDKVTLATQRLEEARDRSERLAEENRELAARVEETRATGVPEEKLEELNRELEEARARSERLAGENRELASQVEEIRTSSVPPEKLEELIQELEEARDRLERLAGEKRELASQVEELRTSSAPPKKMEELQQRLDAAEAQAETLGREKQELAEKARGLEKLAEEKEVLQSRLEEAHGSHEAALLRLKDVEKERQTLQDQLEALKEGQEKEIPEERYAALSGKVEALSRDLTAAVAAKREIEEQAKLLLEKRETTKPEEGPGATEELARTRQEIRDLQERLSETESRLKNALEGLDGAQNKYASLEEERDRLRESLASLEDVREEAREREVARERLQRDLEESGRLAADETAKRMELEGRLQSQTQESRLLAKELAETRRRLEETLQDRSRVPDLENRLEAESQLRARTEVQVGELTQEKERLTGDLSRALGRCRELETLLEGLGEETGGNGRKEEGAAPALTQRLDQLEEALERTVREAQAVLVSQKDREYTLEESVQSLMRSLEEEKAVFRREREEWIAREKELKDSFEEAVRESRLLMGDAARYYPMHVPRHQRPLEVLTGTKRFGLYAVSALAVVVLALGGAFILSRSGKDRAVVSEVPGPQAEVPRREEGPGQPPGAWVNTAGPAEAYEEIWRKNTVHSVSDDMMIQATIHTREELEAAIQYTSWKEGWTRERTLHALGELNRTYDLQGSYYVTVFTKNLKAGYPGYADRFQNHIALRDQTGREIMASVSGDLDDRKFITSRVSAAGKEMNPDYLYEVGVTVAFPKSGLEKAPRGLQLVLYDVGAVPMRVLTWDMGTVGSLS